MSGSLTRPRFAERWQLPLAWIALVLVEVTTQLALKFAGARIGPFDFSVGAIARAVACGWLWLALAAYLGGFVAWMLILRQTDLSRAYPASAVVFVAVMLSSWLVLHEPIHGLHLLGAGVIVLGILQLGAGAATETRTKYLEE